jgi:hypothetical protein
MRRRSRATSKGWDTRIRNQGYRQIVKTVVNRNQMASALSSLANLGEGVYKAAYPRHYRRNKIAKKMDKYI